MSKPFAKFCAERAGDPGRAVSETAARLQRWANMSGSVTVTLDEVAWLGAVMYLAGVMVESDDQPNASVVKEGNVVTVIAGDSPGRIKDGVARQ